MDEDSFRQFDAGRHEERRPVHGVEPCDVLADDVQARGPELLELLRVDVRIAHAGQVVGECVDPDVHDVVGVSGNLDAPVERGARDRQVLEAALDEADDLVATCRGGNELGMLFVQSEQTVLVGRETEGVVGLLGPLHRGAGLRRLTGAVVQKRGLGFGVEGLVTNRIPPRVRVEVDVARCGHLFPDRLAGDLMIGVGGADEPVVRDVQDLVEVLEHVGVPSRELADVDALFDRCLLHLQTVLVGAGHEEHFMTVQPLEAGERVRGDVLVRVADVRSAVGIRDRCRDVERRSFRAFRGSGVRARGSGRVRQAQSWWAYSIGREQRPSRPRCP